MLRGDQSRIVIGARTSVQDGAVLHCTRELETVVGDDCTIGHLAHLEGCTSRTARSSAPARSCCTARSCAPGALVGAGALVPGGMEVPSGAMALGVPAKLKLDGVRGDMVTHPAEEYVRNWERYRGECAASTELHYTATPIAVADERPIGS